MTSWRAVFVPSVRAVVGCARTYHRPDCGPRLGGLRRTHFSPRSGPSPHPIGLSRKPETSPAAAHPRSSRSAAAKTPFSGEFLFSAQPRHTSRANSASPSTMDPGHEPAPVLVRADDARSFVKAVLMGNGVKDSNAAIIADCLVQADLRGVDSHGINRIPSYLARVRNAVLDPGAEPTLTQVTPVVGQVSTVLLPLEDHAPGV